MCCRNQTLTQEGASRTQFLSSCPLYLSLVLNTKPNTRTKKVRESIQHTRTQHSHSSQSTHTHSLTHSKHAHAHADSRICFLKIAHIHTFADVHAPRDFLIIYVGSEKKYKEKRTITRGLERERCTDTDRQVVDRQWCIFSCMLSWIERCLVLRGKIKSLMMGVVYV